MTDQFIRVCRIAGSPHSPLAALFVTDSGFAYVGKSASLPRLISAMAAVVGDGDGLCAVYTEGMERLKWAEKMVKRGLLIPSAFPVMREEYPLAFSRLSRAAKTAQKAEDSPPQRGQNSNNWGKAASSPDLKL